MRRLLRWTLYVVGALLLLVAGALAFLQTDPGKRLLASELSSRLSTPESGIEITDIEGWLPLDMRVGSLRLSDRDGVWLTADGVRFDWSPGTLLGGRLSVDEIGAERVELIRPPLGSDEPDPEPPSDEPFRLPELPKSLPPITIERLAVPEILLGEAVLGDTARLALTGSLRASDAGDEVTADIQLERTDEATAAVALKAIAGLDPRTLDLALNVEESGGMIAALADRPDLGEVALTLEGQGPLDAWSGRLRADAGGLALVEADLGLALVDQPVVTIEGALTPGSGALPEDIAGLIGERLSIDLDLVQTRAQALDLRKVAVETRIASLTAEGSVDFEAGDLTLKADLAAPDLAPLEALAKAGLAGSAEAHLVLGGTLDAPEGKLDLALTDPAFDGRRASAVRTTIDLATSAPLSSDRPAFDVTFDGGVEGLSIPDVVLPDPDVTWNAAVSAPLEGEITLRRVAIDTAGTTLALSGAIDPASLDGAVDLTLDAPSLARLAEPYGQPMDGEASITTALVLSNQARDVTVDLAASLSQLEGLPPGAAELLGEKADLQAKIALDPAQTLTLSELALNGAHIGLSGHAETNLDRRNLAGSLALALPDLAVLGELVPPGTEGGLDLDADLGGSLEAPSAELHLTGDGLVLAGEPVPELTVTASGADLIDAANGDLWIDLTARETPATLNLGYRLADGTLTLDGIDLKAPQTQIGGDLAIALESTQIDGALDGRIGDLGALEKLIQQPLGGEVELKASLTPDGDRQNAGITLEGRDITGDFGSLRTLDLEGRATDLFASPGIDAKTSLTGFEQGATKIDALTLSAKGDPGALAFDLDLAGEAVEPLELAADGRVAFTDGLALDLSALSGAFAGEPLRLARPLALRQGADGIRVTGLDLSLGEARLSGDVEIGRETAKGSIDLRSLPLRWSEVFGGPELTGEARADIDLDGRVTDPKLILNVDVGGLLADEVTPGGLPVDIALRALLDRGRLAANLQARGISEKPITATASLPASLKLQPFAFDMPAAGALEGKVDAELQLERLADLLALDGQSMSGRLLADLGIGGTLGEPTVTGPLLLEDAEIENDETATRIHSIDMRAIASSERIEVESLTGRTGKTGRLEAEGWMNLDADADFPLSVTLRLDKAELVDRDDIDGRISGEIAMTGNLAASEIDGDLTVDRLEVSIPDGGGPTLPELEVTEVGGRIVNPPEEEAAEEAKEKPIDPVLNIRISLPNKVFVRGRGLESEWQGDLDITDRASNPAIVGTLSIKKGYFDFLDKRFELALGEITFSGAQPPNPIIALEARAEDDDFTAIIKLNGPANDPQLLLESEPVLPEDEVLARLLFHRELHSGDPVVGVRHSADARGVRKRACVPGAAAGSGHAQRDPLRHLLRPGGGHHRGRIHPRSAELCAIEPLALLGAHAARRRPHGHLRGFRARRSGGRVRYRLGRDARPAWGGYPGRARDHQIHFQRGVGRPRHARGFDRPHVRDRRGGRRCARGARRTDNTLRTRAHRVLRDARDGRHDGGGVAGAAGGTDGRAGTDRKPQPDSARHADHRRRDHDHERRLSSAIGVYQHADHARPRVPAESGRAAAAASKHRVGHGSRLRPPAGEGEPRRGAGGARYQSALRAHRDR